MPQQGAPTGWRAFSSKPVKSIIGRFYWLTRRTRSSMQLWRHGSDFIYTKNSAIGRSDCIYTKNSAMDGPFGGTSGPSRISRKFGASWTDAVRPRSDFPCTKNGGDASENGDFRRRKQRLQGPFFQELSIYIQKELTKF